MPTLIQLYLFQINKLTHEYHHGYGDLRVLHLDRNHLKALNNGIFCKLTNLEELNFEYNRISFIGNSSFLGLTYLKNLYLSGNAFVQINVDDLPFGASVFLYDNSLLQGLEGITSQHRETHDRVYYTHIISNKHTGEKFEILSLFAMIAGPGLL